MCPRRLLGIIRLRVAPHHVGGAVAQQVLDVDLPCRRANGYGSEGVAEAVGVHTLTAPERGDKPHRWTAATMASNVQT